MTDYMNALLICLQPVNFLLIIAMVSLGIVFGAIPGLSATLGIALLLPITFGLSTETSFVLLLAIWIGGVSGTFISAVLIGIPGSSSAIATCFDGFPMTKKGKSIRNWYDGFLYRNGGFRYHCNCIISGYSRICASSGTMGIFFTVFLCHYIDCFFIKRKYF